MKTDLPPLSKHLLKDSWFLVPGRTHEGRQGHKQECKNVSALGEHIACFSEAEGNNPMKVLSGGSIFSDSASENEPYSREEMQKGPFTSLMKKLISTNNFYHST